MYAQYLLDDGSFSIVSNKVDDAELEKLGKAQLEIPEGQDISPFTHKVVDGQFVAYSEDELFERNVAPPGKIDLIFDALLNSGQIDAALVPDALLDEHNQTMRKVTDRAVIAKPMVAMKG